MMTTSAGSSQTRAGQVILARSSVSGKVVFLVSVYVCLIVSINQYDKTTSVFAQDDAYRYAVVVDCGSSGSRAHLFKWPRLANASVQLETLEPMLDPNTGELLIKKVSPGLASLKDKPELASAYMQPLMEFISDKIPQESHFKTQIYFLATAGLRLLSPPERKELLDDITRDLKHEYNFPEIYTGVITGAQEGRFQWFSLNAHAKRLDESNNPFADSTFHCRAATSRRLGLIEMGGASVQVAFEMTQDLDKLLTAQMMGHPDALEAYLASQTELRLDPEDKHKVHLFSVSFLGLGSDSAYELATDLLVRRELFPMSETNVSLTQVEINNPCLPLGATDTLLKPINILTDTSRTIGFQDPDPIEGTLEVTVLGTGNHKQCRHLLTELLSLVKSERLNCKTYEEDAIGETCFMSLLGLPFTPFRFSQFFGLSDLFHTTNEILNMAGTFNFQSISQGAANICSTPFSDLLMQYPEANRVDSRRVLMQCFKINWVLTFLYYGLRLNPKLAHQLKTTDQINGKQSDWTYGAMLVKLHNDIT